MKVFATVEGSGFERVILSKREIGGLLVDDELIEIISFFIPCHNYFTHIFLELFRCN